MAVDIALDGGAGLEHALVHDYKVVVLDRDLPAVHGDGLCRRLVAAGARSRVLMLAGAAHDQDLIDGLGLGADDYLPKPFAFAVLVARIAALARRADPSIPPLLEIATGTRDHRPFLSIANSGPTIPPNEIERLFEPFERLGAARTSHNNDHGLGLSIVQAIANAHDAKLSASARPDGGLHKHFIPIGVGRAKSRPTFGNHRTKRGAQPPSSEADAPARG